MYGFTTKNGDKWRLRKPSLFERQSGESAYRIAYNTTLGDTRLAAAGSSEELAREARARALAAEAIYLLPHLLERPSKNDGGWRVAWPVSDTDALDEFEALEPGLLAEFVSAYINGVLRAGSSDQAGDDGQAKAEADKAEGGEG